MREVDKINQVIDIATENGANQISGVSFDVDDKTGFESEARKKAVEEARKKAGEAAKIAGFKLGRIINYSENFGNNIRPIPLMEGVAADKGTSTPTQIEPGSTDITVSVTLSYEVQ